jgi:SHS family lactate transporter-like MFS transporter
MDAFDYFLLVFVISDVAETFDTSKTKVAIATTLTLAARPIGAALFGYWADKRGRRPALLACVLFYSIVGVATAFSTSLVMLLVLRALYGIGMGGEWGLGASLAMEKIPAEKRGFYSGVLQQGYPVGYLLAAVAFFLVEPIAGWRSLFICAAIAAHPSELSLGKEARGIEFGGGEQRSGRFDRSVSGPVAAPSRE